MKQFLMRGLSLLATLSLAVACTAPAFANADPEEELLGDTLAGAFTTPETIEDIPLEDSLQETGDLPRNPALYEGGETAVEEDGVLSGLLSGFRFFSLGDTSRFSGQTTLNLYCYNASTGKYDYTENVTLSWRDAIAGILRVEEGGFYSYRGSLGKNAVIAAWTAQAVAIHTYLLYNNCQTNRSTSEYYRAASDKDEFCAWLYEAVDSALNKVAVYGSGTTVEGYDLALTSYYASAGYNPDTHAMGTANCSDVWTQSIPYLVGVESPYDMDYCALLNLKWEHSRYNYTRWEELISGLQNLYGITVSNGDTDCIRVTQRSAYGYVTHSGLTVNGQTVDGQKLYTSFRGTNWTTGLASGSYRIDYQPGNMVNEGGSMGTVEEPWHLVAYGNGHGVGLSQVGSLGYAARRGWNAWQILAHYYPGISLYDTAEEQFYTLSESTGKTPLVQPTPAPTPSPSPEPLTRAPGDIVDRGDGAIDLFDLLALARQAAGADNLSGMELRLADLTQDGKVDEQDISALASAIAG